MPCEFAGPHANSSTQLSNVGRRSLTAFDARSYSASLNWSLSYPFRAWLRHARYFPSGEYAGLKLPPADVDTFTGFAAGFVRSSVKISAWVEIAGTGSGFSVNASSFESGEKSHPQLEPSSENGGTSCVSPGFKSRIPPPSTETRNR